METRLSNSLIIGVLVSLVAFASEADATTLRVDFSGAVSQIAGSVYTDDGATVTPLANPVAELGGRVVAGTRFSGSLTFDSRTVPDAVEDVDRGGDIAVYNIRAPFGLQAQLGPFAVSGEDGELSPIVPGYYAQVNLNKNDPTFPSTFDFVWVNTGIPVFAGSPLVLDYGELDLAGPQTEPSITSTSFNLGAYQGQVIFGFGGLEYGGSVNLQVTGVLDHLQETVPEPRSLALVGLALIGALGFRRARA